MSNVIDELRKHKAHITWALDRMPKREGSLDDRNAKIAKEVLRGATYKSAGKNFGLSHDRARCVTWKICARALRTESRFNKKSLWVAHNSGIGHLM